MRLIALALFNLAFGYGFLHGAPPPKCDIVFSIPKDYSGVLVMVFNMPGGQIFGQDYDVANSHTRLPETITVDFDSNGLARIGRATLPNVKGRVIVVERETKKEIPLIHRSEDLSRPMPAKAVLSGGGTAFLLRGRKEFSMQPFLVGEPSTFPTKFDLIKQYASQIAAILTKHSGIPVSSEALCPPDDKK